MDLLEGLAAKISNGLVDSNLVDCDWWAEEKIWTPEPHFGPLSFEKFPWEREILNANEDMVSIQKASQMGFSVAAMIKAVFMIDQKRRAVMYVLPTAKHSGKFVKSRLDPLVSGSPRLKGLFQGSDSVGLKMTVADIPLYIEGSVSETGLVSAPVGVVVIDEFDRCNVDTLALVIERLSAHPERHVFALSTPTLPNYGINKQFQLGTQERFMFPCPCCGRRIELLWPDCIEICGEHQTDKECDLSYFKCPECSGKLPHENKSEWLAKAKWEPTHQVKGHRSFYINQMYGPEITPGDLVKAYFTGQNDDTALVQWTNQKLGEGTIARMTRRPGRSTRRVCW
jgi:phage terminase large subunit GpA-like protein